MSIRRVVSRHFAAVCLLVTLVSCGGGPNTPTPTPTPTPQGPAILITGNLGFGTVQVGSVGTLNFQIRNTGNQPLVVTGMTLTGGLAAVTLYSWTSGTIAAGATQDITVEFRPKAAIVYSGVLTVNANHLSGSNTIPVTGGGTLTGVPIFTRSGTGDTVFDIPAHVTRIRITGSYFANSSNFIVRIAGNLIVNELLGTFWGMTTFQGTYLIAGGGTVQITQSSGVGWVFTEVRE